MKHQRHTAQLFGGELVGEHNVELRHIDKLHSQFIGQRHHRRNLIMVTHVKGVVNQVDVVGAHKRLYITERTVEGSRH